MVLSAAQRGAVTSELARAADEYLALPLWEFHPAYALPVLSERRRRGILQGDPEPTGDTEYT